MCHWWCALSLILTWSTAVIAGEFVLAFEHDKAYQQGTTYVAKITGIENGKTVVRTEILTIRPRPAGVVDPKQDDETLYAPRCFDPGYYRLTVHAQRGEFVSKDSEPIVEIDLTSATPCRPITVVSKPPSKGSSSPAGPIVLGTAAAFGGTVLLMEGATPPPLPALPNLDCVSWKVTGPCFCNPFTPCLSVEYYEPGWLIETVLQPGTTAISELAPLLDAAFAVAGTSLPGGGGAGNTGGSGHTNLHFTEAHVYTFPQVLGGPCTSCAPSGGLALNYASEMDAATWRVDVSVPSPLELLQQIGVWGRLYPRSGKVIHSSKPVVSGLVAARAMDIAFQPIGTPPNVDTHVVVKPTGSFSRCFQLAWPKRTPCLPAGTPPPLWDLASVSPDGKYIWIIWRKRTCCVNPNQTTCGITLPGVGGHGENWCVLPELPSP